MNLLHAWARVHLDFNHQYGTLLITAKMEIPRNFHIHIIAPSIVIEMNQL